MDAPPLSIIIVTWNASNVITQCLASILEHPPRRPYQIVVVDNGSEDDTVSVVRKRREKGLIRLVEAGKNLGFAGACNEGARLSTGVYLLFLNSDTRARPAAIENLSAFLDTHPQAAAAGGALVDTEGKPQVGFNVRAFPSLLSTSLELLLLDELFPRNPVTRRQRMLDFSYTEVAEVDQPAGACLAVRRDGFLQEGGASLETLDYAEFLSIWYKNLQRYFAKHRGRLACGWLRALVVAGMMARVVVSCVKTPRADLSRREARKAYWKVARNTF